MSDNGRRRRRVQTNVRPSEARTNQNRNNVYSFDKYNARAHGHLENNTPGNKNRVVVKRGKKSSQMRIISIVVFTLVLAYICFYIGTLLNKDRISETKVIMGSVETPKIYNGIIVRDEAVYKTDADGMAVYNVANGDRVKQGTIVCSIQDASVVSELEAGLDVINENIITRQDARKGYSLFENDINDANTQMKKIIDNEAYLSTVIDIKSVYDLKDKIQQKLDMRNKMLLNEDRGSLVSLVQEKNIYENKLNNAISNITCKETGIVSYEVDGLEEILKIDRLTELTKEETQGKPDAIHGEYKKTVSQGDSVFKVVKSNTWYIAAYFPTADVEEWNENSERTLYIQDLDSFSPYTATIHKIIKTASNNETYVVFKFTKLLNDFLDKRSVSFKLYENVSEGLKIPNEAIIDKTLLKIPSKYIFEIEATRTANKSLGVMKLSQSAEDTNNETVVIAVSSSDELYSYIQQDISSLKLGDVLINPQDQSDTFQISEVRNVKGVYVINTGISVFKEINLEGQLASNNSYTVLNPDMNKSIKIEDRIISDARVISSDKKVY